MTAMKLRVEVAPAAGMVRLLAMLDGSDPGLAVTYLAPITGREGGQS